MVDGNGTKLMAEFYARYNIVPFSAAATPARKMGGWFRKEIKTPGRPQGPEVPRAAALPARCWSAWRGAQNIPAGEIYQSAGKRHD